MQHCGSAQQEGLEGAIKAGALGSPSARAEAVCTLDVDSAFFPGLLELPHNLCLWASVIFLCTTPKKSCNPPSGAWFIFFSFLVPSLQSEQQMDVGPLSLPAQQRVVCNCRELAISSV